jgi:hypothetical protein
MNCTTDGALRAYIDHELSAPESDEIKQHLLSCAACRVRVDTIQAGARAVHDELAALTPQEEDVNSVLAYSRFCERYDGREHNTWVNRIFGGWRRPVWGGLAAACVLLAFLSFAPGRSLAQKFLAMLRVQKVAVIPIDLSALTSPDGNSGREKLIAQLISDNVVVTMKPGEPAIASTVQAATEMAGFKVRTLDGLGSPERISVSDEGAFHMTLDRDRIQAVLDQAGRSEIQIPASVDGSTIAVHLSKLVNVRYGNCRITAPVVSDGISQSCVDFVQVPSPIVSVPPGLDIAALAEAGLQFAGMSAAEADAFCKTVDWSSTLVIPVPQSGGSSYRTIPVDGVNGTLIEVPPHDNFIGRYALIWVKNGMVYSLGGKGTSSRALAAVESLN